MARDLRLAGLILLACGAFAVANNALRDKKSLQHVPWVGRDHGKPRPTAIDDPAPRTPAQPSAQRDHEAAAPVHLAVEAEPRGDASSVAKTAPAAPNTPDAHPATAAEQADAKADVGGVVTLDVLLRHFRAQTAHFVDARKADVYARGHLRGAINLPSNAVYDHISLATDFIGSDELVIVYCDGGECEASHEVAGILRDEFGYQNVRIYAKGWAELETSSDFDEFVATGTEP